MENWWTEKIERFFIIKKKLTRLGLLMMKVLNDFRSRNQINTV